MQLLVRHSYTPLSGKRVQLEGPEFSFLLDPCGMFFLFLSRDYTKSAN